MQQKELKSADSQFINTNLSGRKYWNPLYESLAMEPQKKKTLLQPRW